MKIFSNIIFILISCISITYANVLDTTRWHNSAIHLNTEAAESHPLLSADGHTMYFVRNNHPQNIGEEDKADIWISYRDSTGAWGNSVNIGTPLNNDNDNKIVGINLSNEALYLTGDANNQVFYAKNKNRTWSFPRALDIKGISNNAAVLNCHVSLDEKYIIFALSNDSCVGKRDLFISEKTNLDTWSAPRSLGALINTAGDEANVFLAADNKTLYFSSNGRDGLGGLDWYMSRRLDDTWLSWSLPKNLGVTINTPSDDLYFCINTELQECYGIRQNSSADSDIARYFLHDDSLLPAKTILVYGKVQLQNGEPVQTIVEIQRLKKTEADNNTFSKSDGSFQVLLSENDQTGFFALDKNMFSSLAYINLKAAPLKILDDSGMPNLIAKDSIRLLNIEKLQIRLTNLNLLITDLEKNPVRAKSLDFAHLPDLINESNSFEVNQKLERQRFVYNQKYGKKETKNDLVLIENTSKSYENENLNPAIESAFPENTSHKLDAMKKGFEEQKKSKENPTPVIIDESENNTSSTSKEEERQAIEEVKELHGANENSPDFDVLLANTQRKIVLSSITDVKEELQKEFIQGWDNWQLLDFSVEEERKVKNKLSDTQRRLKQNLEERNTLEESRNGSVVVFTDDEAIVAKEIKRSVINNLRGYLSSAILQEINYQMQFRLNNELRGILYKLLEKEKRNGKNIPNLPIVEDKNDDLDVAENEQKSHFTIVLYPLKANVNIPLNGLYFSQNTADLLPESEAELARIQRLFEEDPFRVIELSAHTHGYCSTEFADLITQNRLQNIKKAIIARGISENHIWLHPYGKNAPLAPNNTLEGRLLNQRIEMKLINR